MVNHWRYRLLSLAIACVVVLSALLVTPPLTQAALSVKQSLVMRVVDRVGAPVAGADIFVDGQHAGWVDSFGEFRGDVLVKIAQPTHIVVRKARAHGVESAEKFWTPRREDETIRLGLVVDRR